MKCLHAILFSATALGWASAAQSADIPVKAPVAKAPASAQIFTWDAAVYGGFAWTKTGEEGPEGPYIRDNVKVYGGDVRANLWLTPPRSPGTSLQLNISGERTTEMEISGGKHDSRHGYMYSAHFAARDPNSYALGLFAGRIHSNNMEDEGPLTYWMYGIEGQKYVKLYNNEGTIYAQAGRIDRASGPNQYEPDNMWFGRLGYTWYLTPNDALTGDLSYARGPVFDRPGHKTFLQYSLLYERRLAGTPYSVFMEGAGLSMKGTEFPIFRAYEYLLVFGLKAQLGDPTLIGRDRKDLPWSDPKFFQRVLPWSWQVG